MNTQAISDKEHKIRSRIISTLLVIGYCCLIMPIYAQSPKPVKTQARVDSDAVENLFFSALREKTVENNTQAADLFSKILTIDPANDASLYELANIKKQQNKFAEAQPLLEKAVAIKPDNEWYWSSLAEVYEKNNDIGKLENVFGQLIRLNPTRADYYFDKANAYFLGNKFDEALKVYDQLEQITGPSDDLILNRQKIYLKQGKVDKAAAGLEQMIVASPGQVKYYLLLAEIYVSNNAGDKAFKVLEKAKTVDPNNALVHLALADIYRERKDIDASFKELQSAFTNPDLSIDQKVRIVMGYFPKFNEPNVRSGALSSALELSRIIINIHPNEAKAYALYGDVLVQDEKYNEAKTAYERSIALNGQIYETREQLVRIELSNNDMDGVIRDGEVALSFFPNQGWMNYYVGTAWLQKKDYKKALSYLKNTTSLEFQDKELLSLSYSQLGDCYHAMQNNKSSDESYDKSLSYNPDNRYTLNNYAYYLSIRGEQLDKAAQMAKHANELEANNASFEDTYAWILFKQKNYKEAKAWMERALTDGKNKSAVQAEHYGDILFYLGDTDAAVQNWKKAKGYGANSPALDRKINEKKYSE
ncbi:tetratricopeptide repeat protein [Mucilaginibacter sp. UR6-11]|uniref:tetratricopeptide repeat protein n=1 Tax=Mucilaginibacter sp. UR6-11 TaxID=1435644 RepID=UPI001E5A64D2|nr:tetratricopeptide repeat protein [Mucilaginibacter sp. UR6-11]MCC8425227.1 tetratricopeptide repeat protein [Mucilaginibacter sp. UR6-11]